MRLVRTCFDCVFLSTNWQTDQEECRAAEPVERTLSGSELDESMSADGHPPEWCPLRAGPIVVELVRP